MADIKNRDPEPGVDQLAPREEAVREGIELLFFAYRDFTAERDAVLVQDRKSTRLNSSHSSISYAVFCLKKKNRPANSWLSGYVPRTAPVSASSSVTTCRLSPRCAGPSRPSF